MKWLPEMDSLLRFLKLPTWMHTDVNVNALMQKVGTEESGRGFVERYIAAPSEKALAREKGGTYLAMLVLSRLKGCGSGPLNPHTPRLFGSPWAVLAQMDYGD